MTTIKTEIEFEHKCNNCGLSEWNGVRIPLKLHYKNNDKDDKHKENIELICVNCYSQTESGKNGKWKKGKIFY